MMQLGWKDKLASKWVEATNEDRIRSEDAMFHWLFAVGFNPPWDSAFFSTLNLSQSIILRKFMEIQAIHLEWSTKKLVTSSLSKQEPILQKLGPTLLQALKMIKIFEILQKTVGS